jgi:hypothetical protein
MTCSGIMLLGLIPLICESGWNEEKAYLFYFFIPVFVAPTVAHLRH